MLISLSERFVFIANLKAASTAIETALRRYAEIALTEARFGKHQSFDDVERRFGWALSLIEPRELFVFGVMRDPVDYMISLYNSHAHPKFRDRPGLYTGSMDFGRFLEEWTVRNADQATPQYLRFLDRNKRLATHYLISYDRLEEGLRFVSDRLRVRGLLPLQRENRSESRLRRAAVQDVQERWIEDRYCRDRHVMATYCNVPLQNRPSIAFEGAVDERALAGAGS
jgi:hypothetical protein